MPTAETRSIGTVLAKQRIAAGVIAMTFVGSLVAVSRTLVDAPLFAAQAVRYSVAGILLVAAARLAGVPVVRPRGAEWLWLAGIAATGLVLFNIAVVRGVAQAEPAAIAVAVACVPIVLGIVGPLLEHRAPRRRTLLAALVVTSGSIVVEGAGRTNVIGVAWAILVLACEAAFTLLAVPVLPRHGSWGTSVHSVWMGAVMFVALSIFTEGTAGVTKLTAADWEATAYLVAVTVLAFVLWYSAVATLGAGRAGLLTGIAPISAAIIGIALGTRTPSPLVWLGIVIVIAGLAVGLRPGAYA
jgi:drug/metabolite transporter (DMT)-like permease